MYAARGVQVAAVNVGVFAVRGGRGRRRHRERARRCAQAKATEAAYTLRDPAEVLAFLARLVAWGRTPASAWHARPACVGWALNLDEPPAPDATGAPAAPALASAAAPAEAGAPPPADAADAGAASQAAPRLRPVRPATGRAYSGALIGSPAAAAAAGREALLGGGGGSASATPRGRPPLPRPPSTGGLAAFAAAGGGSAGPGSAGPGPLSPLARTGSGDADRAPTSPPAPWRAAADAGAPAPALNGGAPSGSTPNGVAAGGSGHGGMAALVAVAAAAAAAAASAERPAPAAEPEPGGYTFGGLGLSFLGRSHSLESNGGVSGFSGCYSSGGETLFFNSGPDAGAALDARSESELPRSELELPRSEFELPRSKLELPRSELSAPRSDSSGGAEQEAGAAGEERPAHAPASEPPR